MKRESQSVLFERRHILYEALLSVKKAEVHHSPRALFDCIGRDRSPSRMGIEIAERCSNSENVFLICYFNYMAA